MHVIGKYRNVTNSASYKIISFNVLVIPSIYKPVYDTNIWKILIYILITNFLALKTRKQSADVINQPRHLISTNVILQSNAKCKASPRILGRDTKETIK